MKQVNQTNWIEKKENTKDNDDPFSDDTHYIENNDMFVWVLEIDIWNTSLHSLEMVNEEHQTEFRWGKEFVKVLSSHLLFLP
jgi:hypothetical protein